MVAPLAADPYKRIMHHTMHHAFKGGFMVARLKLKPKTAASVPAKTPRIALKPKTVKKAPAPPEPEGPLGWAKLVREGGALIVQVGKTKEELAFSTSKVPQIRMRAASEHSEEVDEIDEKYQIEYKDLKSNLTQYRTLIMMGQVLQVRSGKYQVLLDRDPAYPHDIVDEFKRDIRSETRAAAQAMTRKHAKAAAVTSEKIWEFLQDSFRDRDVYQETVVDLLERVLEKGNLNDEDRKLLGRLRMKEGEAAALADRRRPREGDLDRVEVD